MYVIVLDFEKIRIKKLKSNFVFKSLNSATKKIISSLLNFDLIHLHDFNSIFSTQFDRSHLLAPPIGLLSFYFQKKFSLNELLTHFQISSLFFFF